MLNLKLLLELEKIYTDDNGTDMMTRALLREKFETCCLMASKIYKYCTCKSDNSFSEKDPASFLISYLNI